ncbi:3'-5' exonuclease [Weeksellaceae bacterium KMM 9713]|uniref:3'-5' exonuclease n=1 Tax=Profundicola chukchiensis TaxID=2961959 RepID=A0A9X4N0D2_9FLAO|nr:3'-5' exonuclease [Profundicola chukchiensis]MDG4945956.1 3'-5' exonuclease [Profundicola chukchiensis]
MRKLNLTKPICFFDLETTGINVSKDRIVEIAILKVYPSGEKESRTWLVNPEMPIPPETTAIHGITDEDVEDKPTFKELAPQVVQMIEGSDVAGFNSNRFDIPLLAEELLRVGQDLDLKKCRPIDVQVIFHKMEPRNLSAAYKFYCDKDLVNAHSAEADTLATYEILKAQIAKYEELENSIDFLSEYSQHFENADFAGFIGYDDEGHEIFKFGKYKGKKVEDILEKDKGYFGWLQNADFPLYTKKVLTAIQLRKLSL